MKVDELISRLENYDGHLEVVVESKQFGGKDERASVDDVQKALYGLEEVHLIVSPADE